MSSKTYGGSSSGNGRGQGSGDRKKNSAKKEGGGDSNRKKAAGDLNRVDEESDAIDATLPPFMKDLNVDRRLLQNWSNMPNITDRDAGKAAIAGRNVLRDVTPPRAAIWGDGQSNSQARNPNPASDNQSPRPSTATANPSQANSGATRASSNPKPSAAVTQKEQSTDSPLIKIDNISGSWSQQMVTAALRTTVGVDFQPTVVTLFRMPQSENFSTIVKFADAQTARDAAREIVTTNLHGDNQLKVLFLPQSQELPPAPKNRIQLDNVYDRWFTQKVYSAVEAVIKIPGCLQDVEQIMARYPATRSYVLTFSLPEFAEDILPLLKNKTPGGPTTLEANLLPAT